jgi:hypothetical protein
LGNFGIGEMGNLKYPPVGIEWSLFQDYYCSMSSPQITLKKCLDLFSREMNVPLTGIGVITFKESNVPSGPSQTGVKLTKGVQCRIMANGITYDMTGDHEGNYCHWEKV